MNIEKLCDYIGCRNMCGLKDRYCHTCSVKKSYYNEATKERRRNSPLDHKKHKARCLLQYAVRSGRIIRGNCQVDSCNTIGEGHHTDYDFPYIVLWLCKEHHDEHHYMNRQLAN